MAALVALYGCGSVASDSPGGQGGTTASAGGSGAAAGATGASASQSASGSGNAAGGTSAVGSGAAPSSGGIGVMSGGSSGVNHGGTTAASGGSVSGGATGNGGSGGLASGGAAGASSTGGVSNGGSGGTTTTGGAYWKPTAGTTWQWQLTGNIDQSIEVAVYDIDGFDNDASVVKALHDKGRKVICYLSVGSYEDWRPDASKFPAAVLGKDYPGWPGEKFVDIRAKALRDIMATRFDMCKQKGFDGVEPDNMDVYSDDSGFPLTEQDGVDYANWMATEIHARGMNIGQKNASELAKKLQPTFEWVLTEDCYDQGWCADVQVYVDNNKPVFMSEYTDTGVDFTAACNFGKPKKYSPILKGRDLDAPVQFCK